MKTKTYQKLSKNIEAYRFEAIRDLVVPVRECDTTVMEGFESNEENSCVTLKSYVEVREKRNGKLITSLSSR